MLLYSSIRSGWLRLPCMIIWASLGVNDAYLGLKDTGRSTADVPPGDGRLPRRAADCTTQNGRPGWPWLISGVFFCEGDTPNNTSYVESKQNNSVYLLITSIIQDKTDETMSGPERIDDELQSKSLCSHIVGEPCRAMTRLKAPHYSLQS